MVWDVMDGIFWDEIMWKLGQKWIKNCGSVIGEKNRYKLK